MKQVLEDALNAGVQEYLQREKHEEGVFTVALSRPKQKEHGDYSCNVAMAMASKLGIKPREVAASLIDCVVWPEAVEKTEIAGPGFINIYLLEASEAEVVKKVIAQGVAYGRVQNKAPKPLNLEFVSANPTGPMHVGHGRGAVVGDALARVLASQGNDVHKEYYINDAGAQIGVLADSVWLRIRELSGESIEFPERAYPGEYIFDIARVILGKHSIDELRAMEEAARTALIGAEAIAANMDTIRDDLAALGITFDLFFSEKELHDSGKVQMLIEKLKADDLVYLGILPPPKGKEIEDYEPTEQWLFRTTSYGDDVDRPLAKQDGSPTYFAADIAYHMDKHERGFARQIDVWGADHGGYVSRVQAAMKALTGKKNTPEVLLVQMVNLTRDGKPVRMSKRAGTFVTLREVVDEVGRDAVRFNFLTRRAESQLDFDLEVAKQKNDENPVYYVQYAHARVCSILRKAAEDGIAVPDVANTDVSLLVSDEEKTLIAAMLGYPEMLATAAERHEAYRVAMFLMRLAADFHTFYHKQRVVGEDVSLTAARLLLITAVSQVLKNGLEILGVSAPERM